VANATSLTPLQWSADLRRYALKTGNSMLLGIVGFALVLWGFSAGFGTRENNRAQIFQGPVGTFVNLAIIVIGISMVISAIF